MSSSRINNCPASLRHRLEQAVNHLHWDGHPLLLECLKQLVHVWGVFTLPLQLVPRVFASSLGTWKARGKFGRAVGEELCDAVCCMESGIVMLKYRAIQCLMPKLRDVCHSVMFKQGFAVKLNTNKILLPNYIQSDFTYLPIAYFLGLEFGKFQTAVDNREKWRKLVAKSSVVSQRPSR